MKLYFVRHGETKENKEGIYYGKTDSVLSTEGKVQMQKMVPFFEEKQWDAVFVSPLERAKQSAQILLPRTEKIVDARLEERNFGIFEGKSYKEILRFYPVEAKSWAEDWMNYRIPKGESFLDVQQRIESFSKELLRHNWENVLIVSHKGTIIQLFMAILELPLEHFWKFTLEQGCYSVINITYGNAVLMALNQKL